MYIHNIVQYFYSATKITQVLYHHSITLKKTVSYSNINQTLCILGFLFVSSCEELTETLNILVIVTKYKL